MVMAAFLNVHKPRGITSRDVVNRVCRVVGVKRVGHAGTLDPLATGVLVVAIGVASRLVEYVQRQSKEYVALLRLGETSDTDDAEGWIQPADGARTPSEAELLAALPAYVGTILQRPPAYSAIKVAGRRAYALARAGKDVSLEPRPVRIDSIDCLDFQPPHVRLRITCGAGVYIRSLARDLGEKVAGGALLAELVRTRVGSFRLDDAVPLDTLTTENWNGHAIAPALALGDMPKVVVPETAAPRFLLGQAIELSDEGALVESLDGEVAAVDEQGEFLGIAVIDGPAKRLFPRKLGFVSR